MEIIEEVLNGKPVEDAIKGDDPKIYQTKKEHKEKEAKEKEPKEKEPKEKEAKEKEPKEKESTTKPKKENLQLQKKKVEEIYKICEFCGKQDKEFSDSNNLDIHLWKDCLILTTCLKCA